jgi:uncharacterized protein YbjT (DUF2867 family)
MILVTGATGQTGTALVERLSARGVPTRALVRDPAKASRLADLANVEVAVGDLARPETLEDALRGVERAALISSSDPAMEVVQTSFVGAAKEAGVRHVVKLSGIVADLASPFRFARMHRAIEQVIERSGMRYTHLRAGEFMQVYFRAVPGILAKGALLLPMAGARIASIDIEDVAEVAARVLTEAGHEEKVYPLTGPESLTMAEVAERLSAAIGKPLAYVDLPPEEARRARLAAGMPEYNAEALDELFAERRKGMEATVSPVIPEVFRFRPRSFAEFAKRHAHVFRGS